MNFVILVGVYYQLIYLFVFSFEVVLDRLDLHVEVLLEKDVVGRVLVLIQVNPDVKIHFVVALFKHSFRLVLEIVLNQAMRVLLMKLVVLKEIFPQISSLLFPSYFIEAILNKDLGEQFLN